MSSVNSLITALFKPRRSIGQFVATVTIEEQHRDELVITEHPVEQGPEVTDHSFKKPAQLIIRCAWSNSTLASITSNLTQVLSLLGTQDVISQGTFNFAQEIYQQLLELQASRIPFDINTGKRSYPNMLIRGMEVVTDEKTEHSLFVTLFCQQIIIVQTGTVSLPPREQQQMPQRTMPTVSTGVKQTKPAVPSPGGAAPPAGSAASPAWGSHISATDLLNSGLL